MSYRVKRTLPVGPDHSWVVTPVSPNPLMTGVRPRARVSILVSSYKLGFAEAVQLGVSPMTFRIVSRDWRCTDAVLTSRHNRPANHCCFKAKRLLILILCFCGFQ